MELQLDAPDDILLLSEADAFPDPDFPLEVKEVHQYFQHKFHAHRNFTEMVLITNGRGVHYIDNFRHPIGVGDLLIVPEGIVHRYESLIDLRYFNILFNPARLNIPMQDLHTVPGAEDLFPRPKASKLQRCFCHLKPEAFEKARIMSRELHTTLAKKIPGMRFSAQAQFMLLLDFLCRGFADSFKYEPTTDVTRLSKLAEELENKFSRQWSVEDMCKITKLSRPILYREFKKIFNTSPMDYLLSVRMRHACIMLTQGSQSIGEIAIQCGFTDSSYFILRFRKRTGMTPRDFRHAAR